MAGVTGALTLEETIAIGERPMWVLPLRAVQVQAAM